MHNRAPAHYAQNDREWLDAHYTKILLKSVTYTFQSCMVTLVFKVKTYRCNDVITFNVRHFNKIVCFAINV